MKVAHDVKNVEVVGTCVAPDPDPELQIPVFPTRYARAWPVHPSGETAIYMPLCAILTSDFDSDAVFASYSAPEQPRRLSKGAVGLTRIDVPLVVFDIDDDDAHRAGEPASAAWRRATIRRVEQLFSKVGHGFCAQTRGGARLVYRRRPAKSLQRAADVKDLKVSFFQDACELARHGLHADLAANDWQRLHRVPHGTRESARGPERRGTCGDASAVAVWRRSRPTSLAEDAALAAKLAGNDKRWLPAARLLQARLAPQRAVPSAPLPNLGARYARAALAHASRQVSSTVVNRNSVLNDQTFAVARFVEAGELAEAVVRRVLVDAARRCGLPGVEAERTIRSAIEARRGA
jgi:hypothetical protein